MFGDWRWGEHVAGTRERFLFPLLGCCPADTADVEGGCWWAQMMTNVAAGSFVHWYTELRGSPGDMEQAACADPWAFASPGVAAKLGDFPSGDTGPHWSYCCYLQWKLNYFQLWSMQRAMACHSLAAGAQLSLYAFEEEVMVLQLRAHIGQI